ncbi:MAG: histidine phosphatase family protein [Planctomycetales bacterium]
MKSLLILRHGKADRPPGVADHERPLKKRGRRDAARIGKLLREEGTVPDRIVSSTAARARETAVLAAEACGHEAAVELSEELYHADPAGALRVLSELYHDDARVLIVGHNPTFEELLERLIGRYERLPTCAVAHVALPIDSWAELDANARGTLVGLWRPKDRERS